MFVNNEGFIEFEHGYVPFIVGSDHESRLALCDPQQLRNLHSYGCNAITATLLGGDMNGQQGRANIHPFIDRKNPGLGYNADVLQKWKNYFDLWHSLHPDNTKWLMLSEHENHRELPWNVWGSFYEKMVEVFGNNRTVFYFEEMPFGPNESMKVEEARDRYKILVSACRKRGALTGYHNPLHIDSYKFLAGEGLIDVVLLQKRLDEIGEAAQDAWSMGIVAGAPWAVINAEITKGAGQGIDEFPPGDLEKWRRWFREGSYRTSGAWLFAGSQDLNVNLDHSPWANHYGEAKRFNTMFSNAYWNRAPWGDAKIETKWLDLIDVKHGEFGGIESRGTSVGGAKGHIAHFTITPLKNGDPNPMVEIRLRVFDPVTLNTTQSTGVFGVGRGAIICPNNPVAPNVRIAFDVLGTVKGGAGVRVDRIEPVS